MGICRTPEEAARGSIPARFVHVVGVVVRGSGGNSTYGFLPTDEGIGTAVVWDEAPSGAAAARFEYDGLEQIVRVQNGAALAVFDGVPLDEAYLVVPRLAAWVAADGSEETVPTFELPDEWRARARALLEGQVEQ